MYKQLNQIDRLFLETSLNQSMPITQIAQFLDRAIMTITREILRNRVSKEYQFDKNQCSFKADCRKRHACGKQDCNRRCCACSLCNKACPSFN